MTAVSKPASSSSRIRVSNEFELRRHEQDVHLQAVAFRVEDLEVEADAVHVERDVLLGLPADDLLGLGHAHAIHLDPFDDDVAAGDRRRGRAGLDSRRSLSARTASTTIR